MVDPAADARAAAAKSAAARAADARAADARAAAARAAAARAADPRSAAARAADPRSAATSAAIPAMKMRLLIDTKANRVLRAEAGKDVVDFLLGILAMPVCNIAKLLRRDGQAAGVANIYDSAEKIDPSYMRSGSVRDALLNPHRYTLLQHPLVRSPASTVQAPVQATTPTSMPQSSSAAQTSVTVASGSSSCGAAGGVRTGGFVQDLVIYTIMDDLTIAPMSITSATDLLSQYKGLVLEEKLVHIGLKERLDILKASMMSNTVLTDVFLSKEETDVSTSNNKSARDNEIPSYYI
ncbi:uncharacterized protein LOC124664086 [Lolium rigidum]|uniref:uncharacterized protein LOC124664086 n=1 Tax=Lolium rigidum TaxID=89674 RepID=UPI001F5C5C80|nr:uncharacterized protein LOC124664086 [Lolium rigidum]